MRGFSGFAMAIVVLVILAVALGNWDPITPAVVEARAETSIGVTEMSVINQGVALLMKLIVGATLAGLFTAAVVEGRKIYRQWWIRERTGRWKPGPNANYQQQSPKLPKLTREDLMLLMLGQQGRGGRVDVLSRLPRSKNPEVEDEIDIRL